MIFSQFMYDYSHDGIITFTFSYLSDKSPMATYIINRFCAKYNLYIDNTSFENNSNSVICWEHVECKSVNPFFDFPIISGIKKEDADISYIHSDHTICVYDPFRNEYYCIDVEGKDPLMYPSKIIFSNDMTICIWPDGDKTFAKVSKDDSMDPKYGVLLCIAKKQFGKGGTARIHDIFNAVDKMLDENNPKPVINLNLNGHIINKNGKK